jgi:hypothetical protein
MRRIITVIAFAAALGACASVGNTPNGYDPNAQRFIPLVADNGYKLDATVYLLVGSGVRYRLGLVTAYSRPVLFLVPERLVASGAEIRVAIRTTPRQDREWVSEPITWSRGQTFKLTIGNIAGHVFLWSAE